MAKILITGASGFIGSFIVEHALELSYEVWAAVRPSSSRKWLTDERIRFITLDFVHEEQLLVQLQAHQQQFGAWDYVVMAAGVTKAKTDAEWVEGNVLTVSHLLHALTQLQMIPRRVVFMSSLSVLGPIKERRIPNQQPYSYEPLASTDHPKPVSAYARSKWEAEKVLAAQKDVPYVVLRPTGVYGPREQDYFLMAKSIKGHVDFAVGWKRQEITFIYVRDLAKAVFQALENGREGETYLLSDGHTYQSSDFSRLLKQTLGVRGVFRIVAPLWITRMVCAVSEWTSRRSRKASTLNLDKFLTLKQRNWRCDIASAQRDFGFSPEYPLERGVEETIFWYKAQGWL
ncbi:MAG: NAD(P)-dependent oxidoreductase [Bacteroidaceae bacterium]|nr:NAD(P)-dependent oxidoreductase [Bacteroidaceae bacterium]